MPAGGWSERLFGPFLHTLGMQTNGCRGGQVCVIYLSLIKFGKGHNEKTTPVQSLYFCRCIHEGKTMNIIKFQKISALNILFSSHFLY